MRVGCGVANIVENAAGTTGGAPSSIRYGRALDTIIIRAMVTGWTTGPDEQRILGMATQLTCLNTRR